MAFLNTEKELKIKLSLQKAEMSKKLESGFSNRDALNVAPDLLEKIIVRKFGDQTLGKFTITEVVAYRGMEDLACYASKGKTPRTEVLFLEGGFVYVYLIYGIYWILNIVTGKKKVPIYRAF